MKALFNLLLLISFVSFSQKAWSQVTYTTNGTCASTLSTYWTSSSCWTRTGNCNSSLFPPTGAGTSACTIKIVINHTVNIASLNLQNFHTLEVGPNGVLNISGSIAQTREVTSNIVVNGGRINLTGSLNPTSGRNGQPKTLLNINLINNGQFTIGGTFNLDNQTEINIDGDGSSKVVTNNIDLGNNATINVKAGGGLIVNNSTAYSGNSSSINVEGVFETQNLSISGGGQTELNVRGNAQVTVRGNVDITGDSKMFFGGDSNVLIEGDIRITGTQSGLTLGENNTTKVEGNVNLVGGATFNIGDSAQLDVDGNLSLSGTSNFIATDNSQTFICGNRPSANTAGVSVTVFCGDLGDGATNCASYEGCRILPVDFAGFDAKFNVQSQSVNLTWSTAKEWNNSHFEIERSIGNVADFKKIGEMTGKGWSDDLSSYTHLDNILPNCNAIAYYRIRQVDYDGKTSISKVVSVQVQVAKETKSAWQAYPNPVRDNQINIKLLDYNAFSGQKIQARIVHANMMLASQELGSVEELNGFLQQQIAKVPKGVFVIEIKWADRIEHLKMLKVQ